MIVPERSLEKTQRWFQAVICHSSGAEDGVLSPEAQNAIEMLPGDVENVIQRSIRLTGLERLSIYADAYYARLLECMSGCFPVLKKTLEVQVFDSFAIEYLQRYPSRSYTLDQLGVNFCRFLMETRPELEDGADTGWPDFLIDLATLEWTIGRVFDGPGCEGEPLLTPETLEAFPPEHFANARLVPVPGFSLLAFRYPVNAYFTAVRRSSEDEIVPIPAQASEQVAVFRRNFIVRRHPLTDLQFVLLKSLQSGATVDESISIAARKTDLDDDSLASALQSWFRLWYREGFFSSVTGSFTKGS